MYWKRLSTATLAALLVATFLAVPAMATQKFEDDKITRAIDTELWLDEEVQSHLIDVTTNNGIVTLSGSVDNILAHDRARKLAGTIRGVRAVVNEIKVKPIIRSDEEITRDIEDAFVTDPATESYEIDTTVSKGVVTLSGNVESWQESRLAELVAKGIKGVREVNNAITVTYPKKRTDYEIKTDVEERLRWDPWVNDTFIKVSVNNGIVRLKGTVGSPSEQWLAVANGWVAGTKDVKDNMKVRTWASSTMKRKSPIHDRSDEEIEKAIVDAFVYDPRVYSFNVDADVESGVVTLTGVVNNLSAKRAAKETAKNTIGVYRVKNYVKVRPKIVPDNTVLESRVRNALSRDAYIEAFEIDVDASNGLIYLFGDVSTSFQKDRAGEIAEWTIGVVDVVNNLDYKYEWTWKSDWMIRNDTRDQIWWSPYVDSEQVSVSVDDGIVTLVGKVDSWMERQIAEQNAFEGGAKAVHNELSVYGYDYLGSGD